MRLLSLSVRNFQCIESAELEFGPGLNVLFGPNDLGKSSLAWAIRAVLLLQYNSAEHERFVSWYSGGDPTVALTLADDEERIWRVTKCFSKTASLESSKNGRDFRSEASARQTDDKLRELLRWGLHRPGGRKGPSGMPRSFLTQVLLSDQDDVRQILGNASLEDDPDQGGRARLTEALGALAQDPLFKRILDQAQTAVDRAFTATGQRKRAAGSPFVAVADKVKELTREREELETRLRDTVAAEERVRRLVIDRDELERNVAEACGALEHGERLLEKRKSRDEVLTTLSVRTGALDAGEAIERRIAARRVEIDEIETDLQSDAALISAAQEDLAEAEHDLSRARERLDSLGQDDPAHTSERKALEEKEKDQIEVVHTARSDVERAEASLRAATSAARTLGESARELAPCDGLVREAAAAAERTRDREGATRAVLETARQHVRDLTSGDRAQSLELRRKELENQQLVAVAKLAENERTVEKAREVEEAFARAISTRAAHQSQLLSVNQSRSDLRALETSRADFESQVVRVHELSTYAQLLALRSSADVAARSLEAAAALRAEADTLREEGRTIRAGVPDELPAAEAIESLRLLSQELRIAEARLGTVSVVVRPRRPLTLHASRDGVAEPPRLVSSPLELAAQHDLVIGIEDLVELEVAGGDDQARKVAAKLQTRWRNDAAPVFSRMGVDNVEDLLALLKGAEEAERVADERERKAEHLQERARQLDETRVAPEPEQIAALEAEMADLDESELKRELAASGTDPTTALRRRAGELDKALRECSAALDDQRGSHLRADAQLENLDRQTRALEAAAEAEQAALGQPWSELAVRAEAAVLASKREIAAIDDQLCGLARSGPAEELAARQAVADCESRLRSDEADRKECARREQDARETLAGQLARVEAARARAKEVDTLGAWANELGAGAIELPLASWRETVGSARQTCDDASRRLEEIREQLARLHQERADAMAKARSDANDAEAAFRAARATVEQLKEKDRKSRDEIAQLKQDVSSDQIELARQDLGTLRAEVARLRAVLAGMGDPVGIDQEELTRRREVANRLAADLETKKEELAEARGGLEQVGGAVVRERKADIDEAIEHANLQWRAVETKYEGWKLLVETLRAAESSESAHLGRALATPVTQRFRQLTGGRYDALEFGAHLEAEGLRAAGELREIAALSAGTQDQLATLLRLCVAEHLKSSIVLDDHLSQSDLDRVAWFKGVLLDASQKVQVLLITCRPFELLRPDEMPDGVAVRSSAGGIVRAIDLSRIIRRYAPAEAPAARADNGTADAPEVRTP